MYQITIINCIKKYTLYALLAAFIGFFYGCDAIKKGGTALGSGLTKGINTDSLGKGFSKGLQQGFADSLSHRQFVNAIDSIISEVGTRANRQVKNIEDSLLNEQVIASLNALKNSLIGNETKEQLQNIVTALKSNLLGKGTQKDLQQLVRMLIAEVGSDSTQQQIVKLRDALLGIDSRKELAGLADSITQTVVSRINKDLNPTIKGDLSLVQKYAKELLILISALAIIISSIIWYRKKKYMDLVKLLTHQIHETPSQQAYDELVGRIQSKAQEKSLEPVLRNILKKQGLLGADKWNDRKVKRDSNSLTMSA